MAAVDVLFSFLYFLDLFFSPFSISRVLKIVCFSRSGCNKTRSSQDQDVIFFNSYIYRCYFYRRKGGSYVFYFSVFLPGFAVHGTWMKHGQAKARRGSRKARRVVTLYFENTEDVRLISFYIRVGHSLRLTSTRALCSNALSLIQPAWLGREQCGVAFSVSASITKTT
jgi:hypothetical protein